MIDINRQGVAGWSSGANVLLVLSALLVTLSGCQTVIADKVTTRQPVTRQKRETTEAIAHSCPEMRKRVIKRLARHIFNHPNDFEAPMWDLKNDSYQLQYYSLESPEDRHQSRKGSDDLDTSKSGFGGIDSLYSTGATTHARRVGRASYPRRNKEMKQRFSDYRKAASGIDADGGSPQFTKTNNYEFFSQEPDIVKSTGNYTYYMSTDEIKVYKTWPPTQVEHIKTLKKYDYFNDAKMNFMDMLIDGKSLVVIGYVPPITRYYNDDENYTPQLTVLVFDLSNPLEIPLKYTLTYEGDYVDARTTPSGTFVMMQTKRVGKELIKYLTETPETVQAIRNIISPNFRKERGTETKKKLNRTARRRIKKLEAYLEKIIPDDAIEMLIPPKSIIAPDEKDPRTSSLYKCDDIIEPSQVNDKTTTFVIARLPKDKNEPSRTVAVLDDFETIYSNGESLYLAQPGRWSRRTSGTGESVISKFKLSADGLPAKYVATGRINGLIYNQFFMSEYNGDLRVVTYLKNTRETNLSILTPDSQKQDLKLVSQISKIAPLEDVKSVRFIGPKAFLVTFRNTDPLFTLDLSNPNDPKIMGYIEIPGFSTYMHPMDENHIITIGEGGYSRNTSGQTSHINAQLQIFDISDMSKPKRTAEFTLNTNSIALYDHHAFTYDPEQHLLSIPVYGTSYPRDRRSRSQKEGNVFGGFFFFNISENKITKLGEIDITELYCGREIVARRTLWRCHQNMDMDSLRSIIMTGKVSDEPNPQTYIYTMSNYGLFVSPLTDLSKVTSLMTELPHGYRVK